MEPIIKDLWAIDLSPGTLTTKSLNSLYPLIIKSIVLSPKKYFLIH